MIYRVKRFSWFFGKKEPKEIGSPIDDQLKEISKKLDSKKDPKFEEGYDETFNIVVTDRGELEIRTVNDENDAYIWEDGKGWIRKYDRYPVRNLKQHILGILKGDIKYHQDYKLNGDQDSYYRPGELDAILKYLKEAEKIIKEAKI